MSLGVIGIVEREGQPSAAGIHGSDRSSTFCAGLSCSADRISNWFASTNLYGRKNHWLRTAGHHYRGPAIGGCVANSGGGPREYVSGNATADKLNSTVHLTDPLMYLPRKPVKEIGKGVVIYNPESLHLVVRGRVTTYLQFWTTLNCGSRSAAGMLEVEHPLKHWRPTCET
jgi:hypothetical protein